MTGHLAIVGVGWGPSCPGLARVCSFSLQVFGQWLLASLSPVLRVLASEEELCPFVFGDGDRHVGGVSELISSFELIWAD